MKNLELLTIDSFEFGYYNDIGHISVDAISRDVFIATGTEVIRFSPVTKEVIGMISVGTIEETGGIVGLQHLLDQESVCIATVNGDLFLWYDDSPSLECVGSVDSGFTCMSWSPDQEVLTLTTGEGKLILMTRDFDPFLETDVYPSDFGDAKPITVGWGKKATQFHGSAGKPNDVDLKSLEVRPILPWDDKNVRISWHGDGQFFAISAVEPSSGSRNVRVWSREGVLFSTNEVVQCLEQALCWRPSGNLIASTERKPNKHEVIFFEKNGLRHGEFTLPFGVQEMKVKELMWNKSSDVLAVWLENLVEHEEKPSKEQKEKPDKDHQNIKSIVQLWTTNNYHWYLKQEMRFRADDGEKVSCLIWDSETSLKLHIVCEGGHYYEYEWNWCVIQSFGHCKENSSTVAVIDGNQLLLTSFKIAIVPPPMAADTIQFSAPINQVAFSPPPACNDLCVVLSNGEIVVLKNIPHQETEKSDSRVVLTFPCLQDSELLQHSISEIPYCFRQIVWWKPDILLVTGLKTEKEDLLCQFGICNESAGKIEIRDVLPLDARILKVCRNADSGSVAVQMKNGEVFKYVIDEDKSKLTPWMSPDGKHVQFPIPCPTMNIFGLQKHEVILGMTEHFRLYSNGNEVANNCTSFNVHDDFLLLTTHTHTCRCIPLNSLQKAQILTEKHFIDESVRRVERGSQIITAVSHDTKVVLQMPRGNLETIHPRALVVSFLKHLLNRLAYNEALILMKKHRINLDLIHDHDPHLFLSNTEQFIKSIESVSHLDLFLADLREDDMTHTLYSAMYTTRNSENKNKDQSTSTVNKLSKINNICSVMRETLTRVDKNKFLLPILTTYAKQSPPDLPTVLLMIKELKDNASLQKTIDAVTYDKALKYILYLVDVNDLYDVALGLYDFDIVLMVAEKSQKDPKEYLPFLNDLKRLKPNFRKYKIDCYLKRYDNALHHIVQCGSSHFQECLQLITSHELYVKALSLFSVNSHEYKEVSKAYGEYLVKKKMAAEAGVVFARCGCHKEALDSFVLSLDWQMAICEAIKLQYSTDDLVKLARTLSGELKRKQHFSEASTVLELYAKDAEEAIATLIEGHLWTDALCLIYSHDRTDIIETNLKPALLEACHHQRDLIADLKERFTTHKERLSVVRKQKEQHMLEILEGTREEGDDDLFSEASSITGQSVTSTSSRGSRMSGHSSKSRRKVQRKKYSLREGSKHEDFALTETLAEIVNTSDRMQGEIGPLLRMLSLYQYQTSATDLQYDFDQFVSLLNNSWNEIWRYKRQNELQNIPTGPQSTVNTILRGLNGAASNFLTDQLPEPTQPVFRKAVDWRLLQLTPINNFASLRT